MNADDLMTPLARSLERARGTGHYREECKHGTVVRQCRCPHPKDATIVSCPAWCPHKKERFHE